MDHLESANIAYQKFQELGPFYGTDVQARPTFRVAASPLYLPASYKDYFYKIGTVIHQVAKLLEQGMLEESEQLHYAAPISWRIDAIIDENGQVKINEINVPDGADALMIAEQRAYNLLPPFGIDTAHAYVKYFDEVCSAHHSSRVAIIAESMSRSPYTANLLRMAKFIESASQGRYSIDVIDRVDVDNYIDWGQYKMVINNGGYISLGQLQDAGLDMNKLGSAGAYTAIGSKAVFAAIHDDTNSLHNKITGSDLKFLKQIVPYTAILRTDEEIKVALDDDKWVVKAFAAPASHINRLERSRAVVGPWSEEADKEKILQLHNLGIKFIKQEFIMPRKFTTVLRANGGKKLESSERFNRICVKYVNIQQAGNCPVPTAIEATLGTGIIPTGRDTCFAPVDFTTDQNID